MNFDAEQINGISFVLQVSLCDGGLYTPYGSRTVSLTGEGGEEGDAQVGSLLTK